MRTFGFALVAVLCTVQLTVALPRPDFGISIDVFSADKTDAVASGVPALLDELWNTDPLNLVANYQDLSDVESDVNDIGEAFTTLVDTLFSAISDLATADAYADGAFGAVTTAIAAFGTYFDGDLQDSYDSLDETLPNNEIVTMLQDAFDKLSNTLDDLTTALDNLQSDIDDVEFAAANTPGGLTKKLLRNILSPSQTTALTIVVEELVSDLPLVFYILMKSKELLQEADNYIGELGDAAGAAVEYINDGLTGLVEEVDAYAADFTDLSSIIAPVAEDNLEFGNLDLTVIPDIQEEVEHITESFGVDFDDTVTYMAEYYTEYSAAIPGVSDGYSDFYSNSCDHIYDLVTVLINFGPYAEYCYEKYKYEALALFDINARLANECVDKEITRLLKLREVLISIVEQMVFSIEDIFETVDVCVANADYCNASDIDEYIMDLHLAIDDHHLIVLEDIVDAETDAGLARLQACFVGAKYGFLPEVWSMQESIAACESVGPN